MKLKKREGEIPKGFWNGGACGGHTFQVDIACLYIDKEFCLYRYAHWLQNAVTL